MKIEKFTLTRHDEYMEGWPDIVRCKNGDLLVFYNECNGHLDRNHTFITMRRSRDGGATWSERVHIGEETHHGKHWNSIRASVHEDGRIILVCDKMDGETLTDSEESHSCRVYTWESYDNGESFVNEKNTGIVGFCTDKVRFLSDGSWLILVSLRSLERGNYEIHAYKSYDLGKTWEYTCVAASNIRYSFIEPNCIELSDGRIVAFLRENSKMNYNGFATASSDKGKTFGELFEIPVPGMHRPFVGRMSDGRLLLSYREFLDGKYPYLKMSVLDECDVAAAASFETYTVDEDKSEQVDQGYSAWVQNGENEILMVNYITDDAPKPYIRGYRITL